MPTIFFSTEDIAGSNIAMALVYNHGFQEKPELKVEGERFKQWFGPNNLGLIELRGHLYETDYLQKLFPPADLWVFASRHKADSGIPTLTVHSTGNWGLKAELGGRPHELGLTSARALKSAFLFLEENKLPGYEASMETDHHGPTSLTTPSIWVELGSSEKQWHDTKAADVVAQAILHCCQNYEQQEGRVALGFGGTHYAPKFNPLEAGELALSHMAAKYDLFFADEAMLQQAIHKTQEEVELALIDWTGCSGEQRNKLIKLLEAAGLPWEKV